MRCVRVDGSQTPSPVHVHVQYETASTTSRNRLLRVYTSDIRLSRFVDTKSVESVRAVMWLALAADHASSFSLGWAMVYIIGEYVLLLWNRRVGRGNRVQ